MTGSEEKLPAPVPADEPDKWLPQEDVLREFRDLTTSAFTVVSSSWADDDGNGGTYTALVPSTLRAEIMKQPGWEATKGGGGPSLVQRGDGQVEYERASEGGLEVLVLHRSFHGVRPGYVEIAEEFRLFHNLSAVPGSHDLVRIASDGTEERAVIIDDDEGVSIRTRLLRQYQAARQLDLVLYMDSVRFASMESAPDYWESRTDTEHIVRNGFDRNTERAGTRLLGKRVVPPPPMDKSGVWPFEPADEHYPEFIIGYDDTGTEIRGVCDPRRLANYFGANAGAPNYLTPVHFDRAVLQKYYNKPELYTVEDGYLRCAGLWGVRIDNDHDDRVVVFLGDLGEYMPRSERDYWLSYNIPPDTSMSPTAIRRGFLAEFADAQSIDLNFRRAYKQFLRDWVAFHGWPLIRPLEGADENLPQQVRIPLSNSQTEFETFLLVLARVIVDSLNDTELDRRLQEPIDGERSIAKLERWLSAVGYRERDRDIGTLRALQRLRTLASAHRKGSGYEEELTKLLGPARGQEAARELLSRVVLFLDDLLEWSKGLQPEE